MKQKFSLSRGFTLVELMIVIAIIGILAAVLYPSMMGYFERTRDTNRTAALKNTAVVLSAYYTDHNEYPYVTSGSGGCLNEVSSLLTQGSIKYTASLPSDPRKGAGLGAGTTGAGACTATDDGGSGYGYKTLALTDGGTNTNSSYVLAAGMEIKANANFSGGLTIYAGANGMGKFSALRKGVIANDALSGPEDWIFVSAQN